MGRKEKANMKYSKSNKHNCHLHRRRYERTTSYSAYYALLPIILSSTNTHTHCHAFTTSIRSSLPFIGTQPPTTTNTHLHLRAPPGSGYFTDEDEESFFPSTYDPMMEYPGTMRPGRTAENQPYSSLPIQESDPDPVPWPHFQQVEWHHNWGSPHEHPIPMEEFIEMHGRWASAEVEAEMRAGARRGVRERRELEEAAKEATAFVVDDDDDEDDEDGEDGVPKLELGEGVDALMGAGNEAAASISQSGKGMVGGGSAMVDEDEDGGDDGDDFLADLGLDGVDDSDDEDEVDDDVDGEEPAFATGDDGTGGLVEALQSMIDAEGGATAGAVDGGDDGEIDIDFDDLGLHFDDEDDEDDDEEDSEGDVSDDDDDDFVIEDDDDISMGGDDMTLDDMLNNEDMGADDEFDDGGFDYD